MEDRVTRKEGRLSAFFDGGFSVCPISDTSFHECEGRCKTMANSRENPSMIGVSAEPCRPAGEAVGQRRARREADVTAQIVGVRAGCRYVASLHRQEFLGRGLAERLFERLDEDHQFDRLVVADVVDSVGRAAASGSRVRRVEVGVGLGDAIHDADRAFGNVVDVSEIAPHFAVVEDLDGAAGEDGLGKQPGRHVGTAPGAVNGEIAQAGGRQAVEVAVAVRHQFVGFLGGGVEAERVVDGIMHRKGHPGVAAVHAGAAGVDEVFDAVPAAGFEDVEEADQIALRVGVRIDQRIAHAGLRREVDDALETVGGKQRREARRIGQVEFLEAESGARAVWGLRGQRVEPRPLEPRVVIVVEIVDAGDFVAAREQALRNVHADEPGGAGDENFHARRPIGKYSKPSRRSVAGS